MGRWLCVAGAALGLAVASPGSRGLEGPRAAYAYEFWTRARTSGEAYQLRGFRLFGDELTISRRRFTQSLALVIHDIGELEKQRRRRGLAHADGPVISWHSYLRLEHDFGTFLTGRLPTSPTRRQDALDVIPELDDSAIALGLLYGHLTVEGLLGGRLTVQLGRLAPIDATGAIPFDGAAARLSVATHLEVRVGTGLAVRDSSPLAFAGGELDGTSGAACEEFVEAADQASAQAPGRWQLIDRNRAIADGRYTSDFEYCPQRKELMPTAALALATRQLGAWHGELGYRLARSRSVGLIGAPDRLLGPAGGFDRGLDRGLYPDAAPGWATNLEQLYAAADGRLRWGGTVLAPQAFVRASLAEGVVDRAELSVAATRGRHNLTPGVSRFVPTFDTDSLWAIFGAEPSFDLSLDYRYDGPWQPRGTLWARRYDGAAWAYGAVADLATPLSRRLSLDARAISDAGTGGQRLALHTQLRLTTPRAQLAARAALAWVRPDDRSTFSSSTSATAATTATVRLATGVALHSMLELRAATDERSLRALGVVDFALESER